MFKQRKCLFPNLLGQNLCIGWLIKHWAAVQEENVRALSLINVIKINLSPIHL